MDDVAYGGAATAQESTVNRSTIVTLLSPNAQDGTEFAHVEPASPHGDTGEPGEDWPTAMRFCRRMGEQVRGPEYANAIERPPAGPTLSSWSSALASAAALVLGILAVAIMAHSPAVQVQSSCSGTTAESSVAPRSCQIDAPGSLAHTRSSSPGTRRTHSMDRGAAPGLSS